MKRSRWVFTLRKWLMGSISSTSSSSSHFSLSSFSSTFSLGPFAAEVLTTFAFPFSISFSSSSSFSASLSWIAECNFKSEFPDNAANEEQAEYLMAESLNDLMMSYSSVGFTLFWSRNSATRNRIHIVSISLRRNGTETVWSFSSLRKQPIFSDTRTGFPAKWSLRKEGRNSILITRLYPDLGSASDFLYRVGNLLQAIRSTTQTWVVTRRQHGISDLISQTSFRWETSGGVVKGKEINK